jgi:hypothetical protein
MYNDNVDMTRMIDQSNLSTQRCRLIFLVECSVGGYLVLAKTTIAVKEKCDSMFLYTLPKLNQNVEFNITKIPVCIWCIPRFHYTVVNIVNYFICMLSQSLLILTAMLSMFSLND